MSRLRPHGDAGAVALVVALTSVLLFGTAALAVDLGNAYNRRRESQATADLAALAGAQDLDGTAAGALKARASARDYVARNLPDGGTMPASGWDSNSSAVDGEIEITQSYTRIKVTIPPQTVKFGIATAVGFKQTQVDATATAEIQSPAGLLPFYATGSGADYVCLKDQSNGTQASAVRAALLAAPQDPAPKSLSPTSGSSDGGTQVTISGDNLQKVTTVTFGGVNGTNVVAAGKSVVVTTPPGVTGQIVDVLVYETAGGPAYPSPPLTYTYTAPPVVPAPVITSIAPSTGPDTGGTAVAISGTDLAPTAGGAPVVTFGGTPGTVSAWTATSITVTAPAGTGTVDVKVTANGKTSNAVPYTYTVTVNCGSANANFGFLDIPRSDSTTQTIERNIIQGLDHTLTTFPKAQLPAKDTQCKSGSTAIPGAVLDEPPGVDGANCVLTKQGSTVSATTQALLDGIANLGLKARLENPPDGHKTGTVAGRSPRDSDSITDYLTSGNTNDLLNGTAVISRDIMKCPRFSFVPVLNITAPPQNNGYYPITDFVGVFIEEFVTSNGGAQATAMKAYVIPSTMLPGVLTSDEAGGTTKFTGAGPRVPVLIE